MQNATQKQCFVAFLTRRNGIDAVDSSGLGAGRTLSDWHILSLTIAMKQIVGIALLVAGVVLLCLAFNSYHSAASGVSRVVTGTSTDKTLWLAISGIVGSVIGLGSLFYGAKKA